MASKAKSGTAAARLASLSNQVQRDESSSDMSSELESTLAQAVKDGKIPHAVVYATNKDGSFTYSHAAGLQKYGVSDEPIHEDALFMLASQTKLLTAISSMKIVEQGLIGLDDDVSSHLPELGKQKIITAFDDETKTPTLKDRENPITLRQLLLHTAGVAYAMTPELIKYNALLGVRDENAPTVATRFDYPLVFEPGTSWMYGPGLDWAGILIERLSGTSLEDFQKKHFWTPLNITGITYWPEANPELKDKIPQLTVRGSDGSLKLNSRPTLNANSTDCFGGHGAFARMGDYLKVLQSLLANDGRLLQPSSVEELLRPQVTGAPFEALNFFRKHLGAGLVGEIEPDIEVSYALGGMVFLEDDVGRRRKGTVSWGGMVNPFWLIDREAGIALTVGLQVLPPGDPNCKKMTGLAERAVYKMAGVA